MHGGGAYNPTSEPLLDTEKKGLSQWIMGPLCKLDNNLPTQILEAICEVKFP